MENSLLKMYNPYPLIKVNFLRMTIFIFQSCGPFYRPSNGFSFSSPTLKSESILKSFILLSENYYIHYVLPNKECCKHGSAHKFITCAIIDFKTDKYLARWNQTYSFIIAKHEILNLKKGKMKTYQIGIQMKSCW